MMPEQIEKVLRMRAIHNLHKQLMFRDNELKLCTIGRMASDKYDECTPPRCVQLRKEIEQIKKRMKETQK